VKIACVGAGPAGLYSSILFKLHDPSHEVTVHERNPADAVNGVGVVFWEDLLEGLRHTDPVTAAAVESHAFQWRDQIFLKDGSSPLRDVSTGFSMRRQDLLEILTARAVELGVEIRHDSVVDPVDLPEADLVVAADGANSAIRQQRAPVFGTETRLNRNKYVWLSTPKVFHSFTFALVQTEAGPIWCHAYGFDAQTSTFIVECTPETWTALGFGGMDRAQSLSALARTFAEPLEGAALNSPATREAGLRWLHFNHVKNERWYDANLVLVGDAAHTTHFSIGSGTKLALEDAMALASALRSDPDVTRALEGYSAGRRAVLARMQRDAELSAKWFESMPRYSGLKDEQIFALLLERRSRVLPYLPPTWYLKLKGVRRELVARHETRLHQ